MWFCFVMVFKTRFNHAYHIAFEVLSDTEDPNNITKKEILAGLSQRLTNLLLNPKEVYEACEQYDVYEYKADEGHYNDEPTQQMEYGKGSNSTK